jgi:hypothetical protein
MNMNVKINELFPKKKTFLFNKTNFFFSSKINKKNFQKRHSYCNNESDKDFKRLYSRF